MEQSNTNDVDNAQPPAYNSLFASATTQEHNIVLICTKCGLSVTDELKHIGGDESCKHQMKPPSISRPQIVYPTQSELKWIKSIGNNKSETGRAISQFENDLDELTKLKTQCQYEINLTMQQLKQILTERQAILSKQVEDLYAERTNAIKNCIQRLTSHQSNNIEVKDDAENKLLHSTDIEKRELEIIESCKKIIDSTPNLKYIPIGISMIFTAFSHIQDTINNLGRLKNGGAIDSGKVVLFESQSTDNDDEYVEWHHEQQLQVKQEVQEVQNTEIKVQNVDVKVENAEDEIKNDVALAVQPKIAMSLSQIVGSFDMHRQQIKLTAKISDNKQPFDEKEEKYELFVEIRCVAKNGNDTTEMSENDFVDAVYSKIYDVSELDMTNKKKYVLFVDYKFSDGDEIGIQLRLQCKSSETEVSKLKWSKIICVSIPDESEQSELENINNGQIFYLIALNDEMKQLAAPSMTDMQFGEFKREFLEAFDTEMKDDTTLILTASSLTGEGNDVVLGEKMETNMSRYDSSKFMIKGVIEQKKEKRKEQNVAVEPKLPRTIVFVVNCMDETKKKIVLRRKNGYNMDSLNKVLRERLKDDTPYWLQCDNTIIREDAQIIEHLQNNPSCFLVPKNN